MSIGDHEIEVGAWPLTFLDDVTMEDSMQSTSDERTVNNVMRHEYKVLSDVEKSNMQAVKDYGLGFYELCDKVGQSREMSLAKTNIEQAVMWAVKHITK